MAPTAKSPHQIVPVPSVQSPKSKNGRATWFCPFPDCGKTYSQNLDGAMHANYYKHYNDVHIVPLPFQSVASVGTPNVKVEMCYPSTPPTATQSRFVSALAAEKSPIDELTSAMGDMGLEEQELIVAQLEATLKLEKFKLARMRIVPTSY